MNANTLAWVVRTVMVVATALATYFVANANQLGLSQPVVVLLGAIPIIAAALNAQTIATKIGGTP